MIERTLAIIKPDAVAGRHVGEIITMTEISGLEIIGMKLVRLTVEQASRFYAVHKGQPFYEPLVKFMTGGPCIVMALEGENAVGRWRDLMGPTDSTVAPAGTIRRSFGTTVRHNAVHGSDSFQSADIELLFFFDAGELPGTRQAG